MVRTEHHRISFTNSNVALTDRTSIIQYKGERILEYLVKLYSETLNTSHYKVLTEVRNLYATNRQGRECIL